ncbi:hypothetical protein B0H21DRAFT_866317 [Amylocystis lapponica]|nr:hypothetical protein B0H21DRAFT_866317 [Amylocystis lapponica]
MDPLDPEKAPALHNHSRSESRVPLLQFYDSFASPPDSPLSSTVSSPIHARRLLSPVLRRLFFALVFSLCAVSLAALVTLTSFVPSTHPESAASAPVSQPSPEDSHPIAPVHDTIDYEQTQADAAFSPYVLGPPTSRFRDNLRNDTKYVTSWISAGWTNDVMTYANLIYLGTITDRVPIIAMFTPSHIGGDAETIAFGDVFDVPRFTKHSGIPIIEWHQVKDPSSGELEDLGCWDIWEAVQQNEHFPRNSAVLSHLGLDISYTKAPAWIKLIPNYERAKSIGDPLPSPQHQALLDPDEQVLCYDYLYYVCAQQSSEFERDFSPAWRYVARHFRWTEHIQNLTSLYIRHAFDLPRDADIPPYIAIHVRHGDFKNWCWDAEEPEDCFAPIPVIARRVREVQDELRTRKGIDIPDTRVVVTSDEADEAWWAEAQSYGWVKIDHDVMQTAETYGRWFPVLLDAAIQSSGLGFVGTDRSTYSVLSRRRVEDWWDGATRMVKWGRKDADAH